MPEWLTGSEYRQMRGACRRGCSLSMSEDRLLNEYKRLLGLVKKLEQEASVASFCISCETNNDDRLEHADRCTVIEARACLQAQEQ